jgi:Ca-activated chloride channel family protein
MKRAPQLTLLAALSVAVANADVGVLIAPDQQAPDPEIFSLQEMQVDVVIDNGDAKVSIREIFASHKSGVPEGQFTFALPERAMISDFAVWDDVTRIPGVILERRRAEEIYNSLKAQKIDPGLLQQGERGGADEAARSQVFSCKIMPIPAFGTKRVELEYHERIPVENLRSSFSLPLRPDAYDIQTAGQLRITFELHSAHSLKDFRAAGKTYPLKISERGEHVVKASFSGRDVQLAEDFTVRYDLDPARAGAMEALAWRNPAENDPGFFQASGLLPPAKQATAGPRTLVILFDTSLSMQWEKLERSFGALEGLLHSLRPADRFNLLLFNSEVKSYAPAPVAASKAEVQKALGFVRAGELRGGTDIQAALTKALAQPLDHAADNYIVLLTDGGATRGTIRNSKLAEWYRAKKPPRTYVFGVGDDANLPLLEMLARNDGVLEVVRSTEPIEFKLQTFIGKIGQRPVENLNLTAAPASNFDMVYALEDNFFPGAIASWVGRYRKPIEATFTAGEMKQTVSLPVQALEHTQLPRTWAKARVDALLEKIEREGEDRASIDEIIRLSRKYKFVTPYTSFLAVPRALLRPRVIRPGDPVLRIKTDPAIQSVVALFPFGLVKPLRYLSAENMWQTRFLAPADMADGTYQVRLILRDRAGHVYRESKSFVIASKPPVVRVNLAKQRYRRGETVPLRVAASASTRKIVARMYGAAPVSLRWNQKAGSNTGELQIPAELPAGKYAVAVTAEDIAHNIGSQEVWIEVAP